MNVTLDKNSLFKIIGRFLIDFKISEANKVSLNAH